MGLPTSFRPITVRQARLVGPSLTFRPPPLLNQQTQLPQIYSGRLGCRTSLYRTNLWMAESHKCLGPPLQGAQTLPLHDSSLPSRTWAFGASTHMAMIINKVRALSQTALFV